MEVTDTNGASALRGKYLEPGTGSDLLAGLVKMAAELMMERRGRPSRLGCPRAYPVTVVGVLALLGPLATGSVAQHRGQS